MRTELTSAVLATAEGQEADRILRTCVHCGFCLATCPTYRLLGDELDGPRGRIYLIKSVLEGQAVSNETQTHLDRCLTCRSCETTCPSGVEYGKLLDIGRALINDKVKRPFVARVQRRALRWLIPYRHRFSAALGLGRLFRPLLPGAIRSAVPLATSAGNWPQTVHPRRMLVLDGCAQPALAPKTNASTARVLDRLGISLIAPTNAGCCGALSHHLSANEEALEMMRNNIDAWWPYIEDGIEALVMTASGCGVHVKEYGYLLSHDADYAEKARRVSELTKDISEILIDEDLSKLAAPAKTPKTVSFHPPCTLQHGQQVKGVVEQILEKSGYQLNTVADAFLCCGSAGTYSILEPKLAKQMRNDKISALEADAPEIIATANIGCQSWLQQQSEAPVVHWIELLDPK